MALECLGVKSMSVNGLRIKELGEMFTELPLRTFQGADDWLANICLIHTRIGEILVFKQVEYGTPGTTVSRSGDL
jgi:hypothetical protein